MARVDVINFMANVGRDSWVHRLDPRTKVAIIIFFSTIPLIFSDWRYMLACLLLALPLWLTANINFRPMTGPFSAVGILLFVVFLFNAIRGPDELTGAMSDAWSYYTWYIQWGPIVMTSHTILRAFFLALRLLAPLTIGLLVIATTDPTYLAKGLRKLGLPVAAVFMVLAGLRFIPIVMEQLFNILDAMVIRGVGSSRFERTKLLILPLFITSLRRTKTMGLACESKAFGARKWNNFYEEFRFQRPDIIILVITGVLFVAGLVVRYGFGLGVAPVGYLR
jgi:energy-coupling factor transport system permease protein